MHRSTVRGEVGARLRSAGRQPRVFCCYVGAGERSQRGARVHGEEKRRKGRGGGGGGRGGAAVEQRAAGGERKAREATTVAANNNNNTPPWLLVCVSLERFSIAVSRRARGVSIAVW